LNKRTVENNLEEGKRMKENFKEIEPESKKQEYYEISIKKDGNLYIWPMVNSVKMLLKNIGSEKEINKINTLCG
jgi:hypothetical protein